MSAPRMASDRDGGAASAAVAPTIDVATSDPAPATTVLLLIAFMLVPIPNAVSSEGWATAPRRSMVDLSALVRIGVVHEDTGRHEVQEGLHQPLVLGERVEDRVL